MAVTLFLTRNPLKAFTHGRQSGRWGELVAIKGPKVSSVRLTPGNGGSSGAGADCIPVHSGTLELSTAGGGGISDVIRFTSMERFKTDTGKGYYVQLHPKPDPYWITYESGNSAVKHLRKGHDGRCFRVHGGKPGPEQGILIHEAPHVGWVIGCISPRPLNNFTTEFPNDSTNPSYRAMDELFQFVGRSRADLFVLDW
jgi:hypothetical protein